MTTAPGDLDHISTAAEFAEVINQMIDQRVSQLQNYRIGRVYALSADNSTVQVVFPEAQDSPVEVPVTSVAPTSVGQVVLILVLNQRQFVLVQVYGAVQFQDALGAALDAPTNLRVAGQTGYTVTVAWDEVPGATKYELQYGGDAGFATASSVKTTANSATISGLGISSQFFRVRAVNFWDIDAGPWSASLPVTVRAYVSDGVAPVNSPATTVYPGIGYLIAKWNAQPNTDPVTYEVHISATNGFTPTSATKVLETVSTYAFIKTLGDGTVLAYDTTYYVRVIAKDSDGSAVPGAQGSGAPQKVQTGDAGTIASSATTDGLAPSTAPTNVAVVGGPGYLYVTWTLITNHDPVSYEVHVSTVTGFTPTANTLVGTTPSSFAFIKKQGSGAANAPLAYATTYYIKIVPRDADGAGPVSAQVTGVPIQINTPDIAVNAIVAGSAIIADAAIGSAKIADAAISNAKIADAAISNAKIQDATIDAAKIKTVYADSIIAGNITATIGITSAGAIIAGASAGQHVTVNSTGLHMYGGDGSTILVDLSTSGTPLLQGVQIKTAVSGQRWEIGPGGQSGQYNFLTGYSGFPGETIASAPRVGTWGDGTNAMLALVSGGTAGHDSSIFLYSGWSDGTQPYVSIQAQNGDKFDFGKDAHWLSVRAGAQGATTQGIQFHDDSGTGWTTRFGMVTNTWWHAGMDGNNAVRWGYDGTWFKTDNLSGLSQPMMLNTIYMNTSPIFLKGRGDTNHFVSWDANQVDGPTIGGWNGAKVYITSTGLFGLIVDSAGVHSGGNVSATRYDTVGQSAGVSWLDRDGGSPRWEFYAQSGIMRFWRSDVSDRLLITPDHLSPSPQDYISLGGSGNRYNGLWINPGNTTASGANCYFNPSGNIQRSTSARKYKKNIQPLVYNSDWLDTINPVMYQSLGTQDDPDVFYVGVVAEDMDAAGNHPFVGYALDDTGATVPDTVQYDRMVVPIIGVLKEFRARIRALEAKDKVTPAVPASNRPIGRPKVIVVPQDPQLAAAGRGGMPPGHNPLSSKGK